MICLFLMAGNLAPAMGGCAAIPEPSVPSQVGATASHLAPTLAPATTPTTAVLIGPSPELPALQITYVCNDGFAVSALGKQILVDALFNDVKGICPANFDEAVRAAEESLQGANLILVSHSHWDHFDPQVVGSYLVRNPESVLIAEQSAAEALAAEFEHFRVVQDRVRGLELDRGQETQMSFSGIEVEVISAPAEVPNLGFIVRVGESTLFHSGDSGYDSAMEAEFRAYGLAARGIDVEFLPYWYSIESSDQSLFAEALPARYYVPMHYAGEELLAIFPALRRFYPHAILFTKALQIWPP